MWELKNNLNSKKELLQHKKITFIKYMKDIQMFSEEALEEGTSFIDEPEAAGVCCGPTLPGVSTGLVTH